MSIYGIASPLTDDWVCQFAPCNVVLIAICGASMGGSSAAFTGQDYRCVVGQRLNVKPLLKRLAQIMPSLISIFKISCVDSLLS